MNRPFMYGKPVAKPYFVDRENESGVLLAEIGNLKDGTCMNLAVLGPRRVGKTSLIKNVILELESEAKVIPVFIDCLSMPSIRRFSSVFVENAKKGYVEKTNDRAYLTKLNEYLKKSASEILLKFSQLDISIASYISIKLSMEDPKAEEAILFENALNYPEELAKSKDVYFVVFLDEFAELAEKERDEFLKLLRTVIQQQTRVMYIFSSSAMTYMNDMVYHNKSPFYRQLKPVFIGPIPGDCARNFIKERFSLANYSIGEKALDVMMQKSNCLPDYLQRLGDALLDTAKNNPINETDVFLAYEEIFVTLDPTFSLVFARLGENSKIYSDIVISTARFAKPSLIARDAGIPPGSLYYYIPYLINLGLIKKIEPGQYCLTDPIFKDWIIRKFQLEN